MKEKPFSSPVTTSLSWHTVELLMVWCGVVWCFTSARLTGMEGVLLGTDFSFLVVKTCEEICLTSE